MRRAPGQRIYDTLSVMGAETWTSARLGRALGCSSTSAAQILARLHQRGLVRRVGGIPASHGGPPTNVWQTTPDGVALAARARPASDLEVLAWLADWGAETRRGIGRELGVCEGTISQILSRLRQRGLVSRERGQRGRWWIRAAGLRVVEQAEGAA